MGQRSDYPGIEQHGKTLRLTFSLNSKRQRETLKWPPTPANWARAAKLREDVQRAIRAGTFQYATYFPDSPRAQVHTKLFQHVAQEWVDIQELAHSTLENYLLILNKHWLPALADKPINLITPGDIKRAVVKAGFKSDKTRNNCISPLKMIFEYAQGEGYISTDPAKGLKHQKTQQALPDPFSISEAQDILAWMLSNRHPQIYHYFRFAFFTGLRSSELIALQWSKVDFNNAIVRVDEAQVLNKVKTTKTNSVRDVELNQEALAALEGQKTHTFLADRHVFENPNTDAPYYNHQAPWLALKACLKALGIRHRPAYNTRHTYATMCLMSGANPYWVSKQLGHASLEMTLKVYAAWIKGADQGREMGKLEAFLGQSLGQNRAIKGNSGAHNNV